MAPLPVIPDVFRCSLVGNRYEGVQPVNVLHLRSATGNGGEVGSSLWAAMQECGYLFGVTPLNFDLLWIDVLPLDGTTATQRVMPPSGWDGADHYTDGGQFVPEAAACVSFKTGIRGPSARGRAFIGPAAEGTIIDGQIVADTRTAMQVAWSELIIQLPAQTVPCQLVVASYVHSEANDVETATVSFQQATQRRRLLQQR